MDSLNPCTGIGTASSDAVGAMPRHPGRTHTWPSRVRRVLVPFASWKARLLSPAQPVGRRTPDPLHTEMRKRYSRLLCIESHPVLVLVGSRSHPGRHPAGGLLGPWGGSQEGEGEVFRGESSGTVEAGASSTGESSRRRRRRATCDAAAHGSPRGPVGRPESPESPAEAAPGLRPGLGVGCVRAPGPAQHPLGGQRHSFGRGHVRSEDRARAQGRAAARTHTPVPPGRALSWPRGSGAALQHDAAAGRGGEPGCGFPAGASRWGRTACAPEGLFPSPQTPLRSDLQRPDRNAPPPRKSGG